MSPSQVWFITGCSSGFGSEITKQALARGDKVIATSRNASKLSDLKALGAHTISLDLTYSDAEMKKLVDDAVAVYGKIDILLFNAGYVLAAAIEEASAEECQAQFTTNVFSQLTLLHAVLPYMRKQKSGVVATMGSIGGWGSTAGIGYYNATKFALVGLFEALKLECAPLGIDVTVIEPGYFRTNFLAGGHQIKAKNPIDEYTPTAGASRDFLDSVNHAQPGDPIKGAAAIVEALTKSGRCEGRKLPVRLPLGSDAMKYCGDKLVFMRGELDEWKEIALSTDHDDVEH